MRVFKRIIPELLRWAVIAAFLTPFAYAASGDKWSIQASPGNSRSITVGDELARYDSEGRYATYDGRDIHLSIGDFTLTDAPITASSDPFMGGWGSGPKASGAITWTQGGWHNLNLSGTSIYSGSDFAAQVTFRVPNDYNSSLTDRFKIIVQQVSSGSYHTTRVPIRLRYNYSASTLSQAADTAPTTSREYSLVGNSFMQEITLTAPDSLVAGGWCTLRIWKSWVSMVSGRMMLADVVYQYNVAN